MSSKSTSTYLKALNEPSNYAIAGVAGGAAALVGLIVVPGLFLEIPVRNRKFNIGGSVFRREKYAYSPAVVATHVFVLALLTFVLVLLINPAFRNM
jgi:hypothetical protein